MEGLTTAVHWEVESLISYVDFGEEEIMHNVITFMGKILIFSVGTKKIFFLQIKSPKTHFLRNLISSWTSLNGEKFLTALSHCTATVFC